MANRRYPVVVATRVTTSERALIDAAAAMDGLPISELVRNAVLPAVRERLEREMQLQPATAK